MIQFLNGYYALISLNVIHRDLKPGNLLMKNKKLKIADFGLSRKIQGDNLMLSLAGTQGYQSP
jgi:serine/threonine protein kinase